MSDAKGDQPTPFQEMSETRSQQPQKYDFDISIDRRGTHAHKLEGPCKKYGKQDLISLGCADYETPIPPEIQRAVMKRAEHPIYGYTAYPDELYTAICGYYKRSLDIETTKEEILFTPGVVPAIAISLEELLKDGGAVCMIHPEYPPFERIVKDCGYKHEIVHMNCTGEGHRIDWEDAEQKISRCTVLLFSSPHNPTGTIFAEQEMRRFSDLCDKYNVTLLSDEIWADVVFPPNKLTSMHNIRRQNTIVCLAGSKTFNIAGLKLSMMLVADPALRARLETKINRLHIGDSNVFAIEALLVAMTECDDWRRQYLAYLWANALHIVDYFQNHMPKITVQLPQATTLLWLDCSQLFKTAQEAAQFCVDAGVYLQPGTDFCERAGAKLRLNFGSPRDLLDKALSRLRAAYDKLDK